MNYDWEKVLDYDYDILCTQNPESTQWSLNMQILTPDTGVPAPWPWWCQAAVHWPACVAAKNAGEETRHRGPGPGLAETRASSDPDTGPDQSLLTLHKLTAQCTVRASENSLTPDTALVRGGGGCGNIVTVSETLRRIQRADQVRM